MDIKSLVNQYKSIEENSSIEAESKDMLLAYYKETFPQKTKISFNIYHTLVPVSASLLVLLFVFIVGSGLFVGAKNTLPGNFLYPVKLGYEEARMITIFDTSKKAVLRAEILTNRLSEVRILAQRKELGEQGLESDLEHLAQNVTQDLQTLKQQIAAQVPQPPDKIEPFPEKELLATDDLIAESPDLPISDHRKVFTVIQSDKLEALLSETKELLMQKDLATALLRIKEAEKLTGDSSPVVPSEPEGRVQESQPTKESQPIEPEPINDQPGSLGNIIQESDLSTDASSEASAKEEAPSGAEKDISIDGTYREKPVSTGMIRE